MPGSLAMIQGAFVRDGPRAGDRHVDRPGQHRRRPRAVRRRRAGAVRQLALDLPDQPAARDRRRSSSPSARSPRPSTRTRPGASTSLGAVLVAVALGGLTYALIESGGAVAPWALVATVLAGTGYVVDERRSDHPMLPLGIFADRTFSAANVMTLVVYAALGAVLFFLVLQLQTVSGYGALRAGIATLPITHLHAVPRRRAVARSATPDRAADPDDGRPAGDGARDPAAAPRRPGRGLLDRRAAWADRLRPRAWR